MALRSAGSRMHTGSSARRSARCLRLQTLVLPVRRQRGTGGEELFRVRAAKLARLSRAQNLARLPTVRCQRLSTDDRRRYRADASHVRFPREGSAARARNSVAQYRDIPVRAGRSAAALEGNWRRYRISQRAERENRDRAAIERSRIRPQRGYWRSLPAARLRRELSPGP